MGCSGSKLEDLEAVALCRGRTDLLADAIRHRYALADAHSAYAHSLRSVGASFHRFLDAATADSLSSSSPRLPLPPQRKGDPLPPPSPVPPAAVPAAAAAVHTRSHSGGSGSHIEFHSSTSDDDSPLHTGGSSPQHLHYHLDNETLAGSTTTTMHFNFARNQPPPPSVSYEHRPQNPYPIYFGGGGGGAAGDPSTSSNPNYFNYANYPYTSNNDYGFFTGPSYSSPPPSLRPPPAAAASKPPPPPPSPPRVSTWDFLNPFEVQDSYYPPAPYTPSRSSREVRDEEGIPDLEPEEEVVKEVYGDQKFAASTSYGGNEEAMRNVGEDSRYKGRAVDAEDEEGVVEKKVVGDEVRRPPEQNVAAAPSSSNQRRYNDVSEIGSEIRVQFERASDAAVELSKVLEVGKHPYQQRRHSVIGVSSRMMCVMPSPTLNGEDFLSFEEDIVVSSGNLSSTLQKLYIWEKKLQDEVRAEEKLRLLHVKNCKRLRHLVDKGAETQKLDECQKLIRKLSTKIRIAIQVVDSISNMINKLRDEELWPQISELIQGLVRMWSTMLECHRIQCHAISEAKNLESITLKGKVNDTHLNAILELELDLLRWIGNFSSWITAQKNYVKALNGWLVLGLHYEPEVTADGIAPYSPGRIGAPPVFIICNNWSQAMDVISEKDVINSMQAFAINLRRIWEQNSLDSHQNMTPNGDMLKSREREAQIIQREVDALNKKLVLVTAHGDFGGYSAETSSLQLGLKQIFEAMENFTAGSLKVYEDLRMRSEEENAEAS